jgi:hypothetical protein
MKKGIIGLIIIIGMFIIISVNASSFSTSISSVSTIEAGKEFTVTFNATGTNIMGIDALLTYDSSKLTLVSSTGVNGYNIVVGTRIIAYKNSGNNGTFAFARITFKAKSNFAVGQSTTISLSDVKGSNGADINGSGSSKTIKVVSSNNNLASLSIDGKLIGGFSTSKTSYSMTVENNVTSVVISATAEDSNSVIIGTGTKNLNVYNNNYNIVVTAENGSKKTYSVTITRKDADGLTALRSGNNSLKSLIITGYDIGFKTDVTKYDLTIENNINKLKVEAIADSAKATLNINNPDELKIGLNVIKITVTAEDGTIKEYIINVTRSNAGPTTTLEKVIDVVMDTTADTINVNIKDSKTEIKKEILDVIKERQKTLIINRLDEQDMIIYSWEIKGNKVNEQTMDVNINFISDIENNIDSLTNHAKYIMLNFSHSGELPEGTLITVYVGDKYKDGDMLKLYSYDADAEKIELVYDNLTVENSYVKFELKHCSNYFLTMANLMMTNQTNNMYILLLGALILIQIIYIINLKKGNLKDEVFQSGNIINEESKTETVSMQTAAKEEKATTKIEINKMLDKDKTMVNDNQVIKPGVLGSELIDDNRNVIEDIPVSKNNENGGLVEVEDPGKSYVVEIVETKQENGLPLNQQNEKKD